LWFNKENNVCGEVEAFDIDKVEEGVEILIESALELVRL